MSRDQVEADWLLEHGRTREEVARMQAAERMLDLLRRTERQLALGDADAYGLMPDTADALNGLRCAVIVLLDELDPPREG